MKEELQSKLVEILTSIQATAGTAKDFALEQLPGIAQEYVAFGRVYHTLWIVSMAVVVSAVIWWTVRLYRRASAPEGVWDGMPPLFALWFGACAGAAPLGALLHNLQPGLLVWFAPKVWLLKELAALVK
jgi:hypothetical protein